MDRRRFISHSLCTTLGMSWAARLAEAAPNARANRLIVLWMAGGPSHIDTFDPKKGVDSAGPFSSIPTKVKGIRISEHLPLIAQQMRSIALIRSMTSPEGNHNRASHLALTGYPATAFVHPTVGSVVAHLDGGKSTLPPYISIGPTRFGGGFLGPTASPFVVRKAGVLPVQAQQKRVRRARMDRRLSLVEFLDARFAKRHPELAEAHQKMRARTLTMVRSKQIDALNLSKAPAHEIARYGDDEFGRGVLVARRLVRAGVKSVQVNLPGWDTHADNFNRVKKLSHSLDRALSSLIADLRASGELGRTLILWMGEFGRTPSIGDNLGRDHYPRAYSAAAIGGGIAGGQVIGETSPTGHEVKKRPVTPQELAATALHLLGIDGNTLVGTPGGRPIRAFNGDAKPIKELLA